MVGPVCVLLCYLNLLLKLPLGHIRSSSMAISLFTRVMCASRDLTRGFKASLCDKGHNNMSWLFILKSI